MMKSSKTLVLSLSAFLLMTQAVHASSMAVTSAATAAGTAMIMIEDPDSLKKDSQQVGAVAGAGTSKAPAAFSASSQGTVAGFSNKSDSRYRIVGDDVVFKEALQFVGELNGESDPESMSPTLRSALIEERRVLKESLPAAQAAQVDSMSDQEVAASLIDRMTDSAK